MDEKEYVGVPGVAILGAGHAGTVVARLASAAGLDVSVATSGAPEEIALTLQVLAPGANARWAADALGEAGVVILAIPLHRLGRLEPEALAGKVVVDMMNYWPQVNGTLAEFEAARGSSEIVQSRLPGARLVKTLNHLGYHQLDEEARASGDPERRALGVAGDDPDALDLTRLVIDRIGFDPVLLGGLRSGRILQPDGPVFGRPMTRTEFERLLEPAAA